MNRNLVLRIAFGFSSVVAIFLIYVALQPSDFKVSRELLINSPAAQIFPHINNSKKANDWMPWTESDPTTQMAFSGPDEGLGSKSSWTAKGDMGEGSAEVIQSIPNQSVTTKLVYTKPMQMEQMALVELIPTGNGTTVRWSVSGKNSFVGRIFCTFMNMDKMVGDMFMKGLTKLKSKVEVAN